jgi:hypothetical protein
MRSLLLIALICLPSCVSVSKDKAFVMGGKGAIKGDGWSLVYNQEKSFSNAASAVGMAVGSYISASVLKVKETTSQMATTNATKTTVNASNNATKTAINQSNNDAAVKLAELPQ